MRRNRRWKEWLHLNNSVKPVLVNQYDKLSEIVTDISHSFQRRGGRTDDIPSCRLAIEGFCRWSAPESDSLDSIMFQSNRYYDVMKRESKWFAPMWIVRNFLTWYTRYETECTVCRPCAVLSQIFFVSEVFGKNTGTDLTYVHPSPGSLQAEHIIITPSVKFANVSHSLSWYKFCVQATCSAILLEQDEQIGIKWNVRCSAHKHSRNSKRLS